MIRVLHLFGSDCGVQTANVAKALLASSPGGIDSVNRRIGRGGDYRSVVDAGLSLRSRGSESADLIHAWDGPALLAAAASGKPVVFSPPAFAPPTFRQMAWANRLRPIDVVCATVVERDACIGQGMAAGRCHVIRPGVSIEQPNSHRRQGIRQRLGIATEDYVLLAPGESSYAADHRLAVHVTSILYVLEPRFRVLLWGRGPQAKSATELGSRLNQPRVVIRADQILGTSVDFVELTAAADAAVVTARQIAPVLPWVTCMAAGLPIVAVDTRQTREVFAQDAASIVEEQGARPLAERVLRLSEDPRQGKNLAQSAAIRAQTFFGRERFAEEYMSLYCSSLSREIERRGIGTNRASDPLMLATSSQPE